MTDYNLEEYAQRSAAFATDLDDYEYLLRLNKTLQATEQTEYRDIDTERPFIFIFGVPRSGTTVLTQLLSYCLDVGYVNNLMARFWLAPLTGVRLSRIILGESHGGAFESQFGRTAELAGRHEYSYFWQHWLKKERLEDYLKVNEGEDACDWDAFSKTMANMQAAFGKAMVFKNIIGANHLRKLTEVLKQVLWVYVERDPMECAMSIYRARQRINSDPSAWWSTHPPEYEALKALPPYDQVAGQVYHLGQLYDSQLKTVPNEQVVRVAYEDVCKGPKNLLEQVVGRTKDLFGYEIAVTGDVPDSFPVSRPDKDCSEYKALEEALKSISKTA